MFRASATCEVRRSSREVLEFVLDLDSPRVRWSAYVQVDRYGHLVPGLAASVADRLDEMAQAAGVVQRAEVMAIDRGR